MNSESLDHLECLINLFFPLVLLKARWGPLVWPTLFCLKHSNTGKHETILIFAGYVSVYLNKAIPLFYKFGFAFSLEAYLKNICVLPKEKNEFLKSLFGFKKVT